MARKKKEEKTTKEEKTKTKKTKKAVKKEEPKKVEKVEKIEEKEEISEEKQKEIEKNTKRAARDMALEYGPFVIAIIFILIIRMFVATLVRVDGESMNNTLTDGDILLLYKLKMKTQGIDRFNIVVLHSEDGALVKRVIGLPGDFIKYEIKEENGVNKSYLFINNKAVEEDFISEDRKLNTCRFKTAICEDGLQLGEDEYFVMGDNRGNSKDSRIIGPVNKKEIKGIVGLRVFPFGGFGKVK